MLGGWQVDHGDTILCTMGRRTQECTEDGLKMELQRIRDMHFRENGWVAERFKAAVLKTANPQGFVGSNPTPSAKKRSPSVPSSSKPRCFPGLPLP